jgi:GT2 family glycosyltransferase
VAVSVTAIVPVWNGRDLLMKLLDTIERQTLKFDEILVIDNGSEDGGPDAAAQRGARVIGLGRNMGFAHAVNRGAQEASSTKIAILNSDVELEPDWLSKLAAADAPFATGKILSASDPKILDGTFDLLCRGGCPWRAGHGKRDAIPAGQIDMASFTAVLFDRNTFLAAGMLDERFESYLEDVDFGLRCAACGIRGAYIPEAVCRHRGSATLGRWHADSVRRMSRNQVFLIAKHYSRSLIQRFWWPILIAHLLWGVLAIRHGAGLAWVRGKFEGCRRIDSEPIPRLDAILEHQEAVIYRLQKQLGMDWYWRVYFGLTGAKRHRITQGQSDD